MKKIKGILTLIIIGTVILTVHTVTRIEFTNSGILVTFRNSNGCYMGK